MFLATLNLGGSGAGLLETPTDLMNADMSVTTRQQISVQQCMRRLKNKIFLSAYRKGDEMTPEEEERGHRLQLARVKKKRNAARALSPDSRGREETEECDPRALCWGGEETEERVFDSDENKSNQPTPWDEPLYAQTSGCENTSQNNAQQQESIIMEHNIINWILLIVHQQRNKPRLFIKRKDVPIL